MRPASCIYEGTIRHRRVEPRREFEHRIALFYLDLEELPGLLGGRIVRPRPGLLRFRRGDYLGPDSIPLVDAVRDAVHAETGRRPDGPIRLLTQLRSFGHCFNPVSFYYCLDGTGEGVDAVVAEVTNTPWGERHAYVIPGANGDMRQGAARVAVHGDGSSLPLPRRRPGPAPRDRRREHQERCADVRRHACPAPEGADEGAAARLAVRYPFANLRVLALIYGHAVGLKLAGAPLHGHPARGST